MRSALGNQSPPCVDVLNPGANGVGGVPPDCLHVQGGGSLAEEVVVHEKCVGIHPGEFRLVEGGLLLSPKVSGEFGSGDFQEFSCWFWR